MRLTINENSTKVLETKEKLECDQMKSTVSLYLTGSVFSKVRPVTMQVFREQKRLRNPKPDILTNSIQHLILQVSSSVNL